MHELALRLGALAVDLGHRASARYVEGHGVDGHGVAGHGVEGHGVEGHGANGRGQRGQATVEYVGLIVVLGTGIGMIATGLDTLGFVTKVGSKLIKGVVGALDKITPG